MSIVEQQPTTALRSEPPSRSDDGRLVVRNLAKRFRSVEAVRDISFTAEPGQVTGFIGPNGAGKTTTLRSLLGLITPTGGTATVNGVPYRELVQPTRVVGAVLDSNGFHRSRKARAHLRIYTAAMGLPDRRADEVLELVGLASVANRKAGGFSLGMRQRLALATALLGDPQVLILDEPGSGLDPEGLAWLRGFLRRYVATGRTVLVSSHQLAEIAQTVDRVVIVSKGRQVFEGRMDELAGDNRDRVRVQCSDADRLAGLLARNGLREVTVLPENWLSIVGATVTQVGDLARTAEVSVYGMHREPADLERRFLQLTESEYLPEAPGGPPDAPPAQPVQPAQSVPTTQEGDR